MTWPSVRIDEACSLITDGTHYSPSESEDGVPFLTVKDMTRDALSFETAIRITREDFQKAAVGNSAPRLGDVLFSKDGTVGKVHVVKETIDFAVLSSIAILRPKPEILDSRFLGHVLRFPMVLQAAANSKTGSALTRIVLKDLKRVRIPLPPLAEQRRIAAVLDKTDAIRRKRRDSVRLLDKFLRSAFLEMFGDVVGQPNTRPVDGGWRIVTVQEIAAENGEACAGGPFGSSLTRADYIPTPGVPVIRGNNLVTERGAFRDEGFVFVSEAKAETLSRNVALPGDIVFTQRGTLGQVAQIPRSARYSRYIISQSQMKVTINEEMVDPTYVVHYFLSPRAVLDMKSRTLATGVPHINLSILKAFPVVLPPLALQRQFAALVSQHEATRARMEAAGRDTEHIFDALAQRAFRGER